jgi:hypothetical protein
VYLLFPNFILYLCPVFKKQCLIKILNVMEKYYLCSIQSKKNPGQNETVLVPIDEVPLFIFSTLNSDCLLIFSDCSTFNSKSNNEK